jgi:Tfp pilus assembly PilM family ATPase
MLVFFYLFHGILFVSMALLTRTRDSVACTIDDRFVRFFHASKTGKKTELKAFFSERIADHLFNEHNELIVDETLVARLQDTRKKYGFSKVHLVIPDRYITVFHTVVPRTVFGGGSKKSLQQSIERYLEKLLVDHPEFSAHDMIADYEVIGETIDGYDVHVSVARPGQFRHIPELFESAGFIIDHIDISSYAIHRLVKYIHGEAMYGTIAIGAHTTYVSMVQKGQILASSWCSVGSDDLIKTLQEKLKITRSEAEKIIHEYGILHMHPDKEVLGALLAVMKPVIESMQQVQVACSPETYQHAFYHGDANHFYMYGIGASISGIGQYLGVKTNARVRPIDILPTEFIDEQIIVQIPVEVLPLYLPVMGTALNYLVE